MYLVFDIGGTNMRVGISSDGSTIPQSKSLSTPADFEEGISQIKKIGMELSQNGKIDKIAGGIAGPLNKEKTLLVAGPHLTDWIQKPLKQRLEVVFSTEVVLENDAALAGLGEAISSAGQNHDIVAYLTIGTGIGGVRVVNGKIDKNSSGFEPGHQIIVPNGHHCECGGSGHLESYVGGIYIERLYGKKAQDLSDEKAWDEVSRYLAIGLNNTIVHWSPDIVVLGGSVAQSIPLDKVQAYLNKYLTIFPNKPPLVKAQLDYPGLYGALQLIKSQLR